MEKISSTLAMTPETGDELDNNTNSTTTPDTSAHYLLRINQVAYLITCIVGSIGNLLVIFTIWKVKRLHTVMYFVLASLGVADLILCLFYLPIALVELFNGERWIWGRAGCKIVFYIYQISCTVSILNLTAVSIERFLAVRLPLRSRQYLTMGNAKIWTVIIWITGFVYCTPVLYTMDTWRHMRDGKYVENCYLILPADIHYSLWYLLYLFIPLFVIPFIIMSLCYSVIIYTIFSREMPGDPSRAPKSQSMQSLKPGGSRQQKTVGVTNGVDNNAKVDKSASKKKELKQLTVMLVIVIVLFIICWGPAYLLQVVLSFGVLNYNLTAEKVTNLCSVLAILNSAMNPVIYAFLSPTFRAGMVYAITSICRRNKARPTQLKYATTVTGTSPGTSIAQTDRNSSTVA